MNKVLFSLEIMVTPESCPGVIRLDSNPKRALALLELCLSFISLCAQVLRNLFVNIHRTFYKNVITWEHQFDRRRRPGHPTGRHDNTKCIACLNGMCVSAIGQSTGQSQAATRESADPEAQSECSPACKRRLIPPPDASPK